MECAECGDAVDQIVTETVEQAIFSVLDQDMAAGGAGKVIFMHVPSIMVTRHGRPAVLEQFLR